MGINRQRTGLYGDWTAFIQSRGGVIIRDVSWHIPDLTFPASGDSRFVFHVEAKTGTAEVL